MAATPSSAAMMSEPPSSPVHIEKSFMTAVTEDDDTRMMATPEPSERQGRGKKRGRDDGSGANGNPIGKIRHLKKDDGEPLWRKDIQFDFLKAVFDNDAKVFTNSYEKDRIGQQCFADLYIDTMSRSSKTSKVLRDKLLSDREAAKGMAMVCLLVNIGRMNTTLNCTSFVLFLPACQCDADRDAQSSPRCEPNCAPTTPSPACRPVKTRTPTNNCKTPPG
jgi:Ino eighty subunit 1